MDLPHHLHQARILVNEDISKSKYFIFNMEEKYSGQLWVTCSEVLKRIFHDTVYGRKDVPRKRDFGFAFKTVHSHTGCSWSFPWTEGSTAWQPHFLNKVQHAFTCLVLHGPPYNIFSCAHTITFVLCVLKTCYEYNTFCFDICMGVSCYEL